MDLIRSKQDTQKELGVFKEGEITFSLKGIKEDFMGEVTLEQGLELRGSICTVS